MKLIKTGNIILALMFFLSGVGYGEEDYLLNDSHLHLTDYIMHGPPLKSVVKIMDKYKIKRCSVFGLPIQLEWNMHMEKSRPPYYLNTNGRLYYYSAVDTIIAREYLALTPEEQTRFDPMICGFNPSDGGAEDHIIRMLSLYPGVFSGLGEFSVYKEMVSARIYGKCLTLKDPALDRVFDLAGKIGLIVNMHCDIDSIAGDKKLNGYPRYAEDLYDLFRRHPETVIIWAHTGLGRYVQPSDFHREIVERIVRDCPNVYMDISWSVVAKIVTKGKKSLDTADKLITQYPDRFLFGTDIVNPTDKKYMKAVHMYDELWKELPENIIKQIRMNNYDRIFGNARKKVRNWERENVEVLVPVINWPFANLPE